ncbi:ribitol-5-phosphate transferase FKTN-like [Haliotis rufescens]|uniref:ribitol-5-phosphate transferase FKTN-like n=1 Tax=Haliotis rufescens TaxID=6454 RepID=UPI00201F086A|nr:ribitol-5-phosphate transferase FKTN-like [Haliotis rufescens]
MVDGIWLYLPHPVEQFLAQVLKAKFTECDYQGAQAYLSQTLPEGSYLTRNGAQVLYQAKRVLDHLGVLFWISGGTCLGWYRQCGLIPYSNDIDVEIPIQHYSANIVPAFLKAGFKLVHVKGKRSDSYQIAMIANNIKFDVYFIYEEKTHRWVGTTDSTNGKKYKYILPKFDTCWTDFKGCRVRVPCPTLPYITAYYGENWNTSVKRWNWRRSNSNAQKNGVWPKDEWKIKKSNRF